MHDGFSSELVKLNHNEVLESLKAIAQPAKALIMAGYFKAGVGEYAEGDQFLGIAVPDQRAIAKKFRELQLDQLKLLLESPWHESRSTALFILVMQFERAKESFRSDIVEFYLANLDAVNNWDLVDSSAPNILGQYALEKVGYRKRIDQLAASGDLWRERISVLATRPQIKDGDFTQFQKFACKFLTHKHDLMHKAVGWMLREMGEQDLYSLLAFLDLWVSKMPRTMLRYAIEKLPDGQRKDYLKR